MWCPGFGVGPHQHGYNEAGEGGEGRIGRKIHLVGNLEQEPSITFLLFSGCGGFCRGLLFSWVAVSLALNVSDHSQFATSHQQPS